MSCFTPNQGYKTILSSGKIGFTRKFSKAITKDGVIQTMQTPCHRCEGCRNDYAKEWAVKIMHEASTHRLIRPKVYVDPVAGVETEAHVLSDNCSFITLTYNDDFIPLYGTLLYEEHWSTFLKRLRLELAEEGIKIRFYMVGEYGTKNLRPHYHAIIFGYSFPDKEFLKVINGNIIYRSKQLERLWTVPRGKKYAGSSLGYSSIGTVSFASAGYVARYSNKKQIGLPQYDNTTGEIINDRYLRVDPVTGDSIIVARERALMSNRPGIGKAWFDKFAMTDLYSKDFTHMPNGLIVRAPKYYDRLLEKMSPELYESIRKSREDYSKAHANEFTPERLAQRRTVFLARTKSLNRNIGDVYEN